MNSSMSEMETVPRIDVEPSSGNTSAEDRRRNTAELELLEAGAQLQVLANREKGQKFWLRWIVAVSGLVIVCGLAFLVYHAMHAVILDAEGPTVPASLAISLFVAPIVSITAITVALIIGAFRRFRDDDLQDVNVSGMTTAATQVARGFTG
jgi:hypothetical protein